MPSPLSRVRTVAGHLRPPGMGPLAPVASGKPTGEYHVWCAWRSHRYGKQYILSNPSHDFVSYAVWQDPGPVDALFPVDPYPLHQTVSEVFGDHGFKSGVAPWDYLDQVWGVGGYYVGVAAKHRTSDGILRGLDLYVLPPNASRHARQKYDWYILRDQSEPRLWWRSKYERPNVSRILQ